MHSRIRFVFKFLAILLIVITFSINSNLLASVSFADESKSEDVLLLPYLVEFKKPAGENEIELIESLDGKVTHRYKTGELRKWLAVEIPETSINKLKNNKNVSTIEEDSIFTIDDPIILPIEYNVPLTKH